MNEIPQKSVQASDYSMPEELAVRSLNVFVGETQLLSEINVTLYKNRVTAVIGPSGCGKTTLLKSINGLFVEDASAGQVRIEGEVRYDGNNIISDFYALFGERKRNRIRREMAYVGQYPQIFDVSIFDNVALAIKYWEPQIERERLDEKVEGSLRKASLFEEVKDRLNKKALTLSVGQQQRLCIARAVALEPRILLLDEPTAHIDPISLAMIEEFIDELKNDHTVLMVTHNMTQAARVSDFAFLMYLGRMIEFDTTTKMYTSPRDRRTQDYITGRFG